MSSREQMHAFESRLLRDMQQRADALIGRKLPGKGIDVMGVADGSEYVSREMQRMGQRDRDLRDSLPGKRAIQISVRRGLLGTLRGQTRHRIRVRTLAPIEALLTGGQGGPIGAEELRNALAQYDELGSRYRPTIVVVGSPTGFTDAAQLLVQSSGMPQLVLVGGREDGGVDVRMSNALKKSDWAELFDFETDDEQLQRFQYHLDKQIDALETRGLSMPELANLLGLSVDEVRPMIRKACRKDTRLMTVMHDGELRLARNPVAAEVNRMSLWSRIRRWLGFKPSVAEQVAEMTKQRIGLEQQRAEVDNKVARLEADERDALKAGATATNMVEKKQLAGKLMRVRRELNRHRAQAQVFTNQIEVLGTHIHHLTLKQQGEKFDLPSAEELTREAAEAEQVMAELSTNAELAHGIEVGAMTPTMAAEEADILKEFEAAAVESSAGKSAEAAAPERGSATPAEPQRMPPLPGEAARGAPAKSPARPEMS